MGAGPTRALTGGRRTKPTSTGCRRLRQPEPGRRSTYQAGEPVQTNRASSLAGYMDALGDRYSKYVLNINGHSHDYERTFPQHGVVHVTIGTGGSPLEEGWLCLW